MYLGIGNQAGSGTVSLTAALYPSRSSVGTRSFYLPYNPVPGVAGVSASGYFYFYWDTPLPSGSRVTVGTSMSYMPALLTVENCAVGDPFPPVYSVVDSTDVPQPIPPLPFVINTVQSKLYVPTSTIISDINVAMNITHTWDSDVVATLTSPAGKSITLFNGVGGSGHDFGSIYMHLWEPVIDYMPAFILDDESAYSIMTATAPFTATSYIPQGHLSEFYGEDAAGIWTLTITDTFPGEDNGMLLRWMLEIKSQLTYLPVIMKSP